MDSQWEIYPIKAVVSQYRPINGQIHWCAFLPIQITKAELDDFKIGLGIPNCVLEAHPLVEPIPRLLHEITMNGVKAPYNKLTLRLSIMPSRKGKHYSIFNQIVTQNSRETVKGKMSVGQFRKWALIFSRRKLSLVWLVDVQR